jgi:hypothetical protein
LEPGRRCRPQRPGRNSEKRRRFGRQPRKANPSSTQPGRGDALRKKPREPWRRAAGRSRNTNRQRACGIREPLTLVRPQREPTPDGGGSREACFGETTGARALARGAAETRHGAARLRAKSIGKEKMRCDFGTKTRLAAQGSGFGRRQENRTLAPLKLNQIPGRASTHGWKARNREQTSQIQNVNKKKKNRRHHQDVKSKFSININKVHNRSTEVSALPPSF